MKNIVQFIKAINIKQVLTVFMAGCLLVISTACNQDSMAQTGNKAEVEKTTMSKNYDRGAASDTYDKYDANQNYKGGMNSYNDDRRLDTDAGTARKTKALVDTAKRRLADNEEADNVGDYVDNFTERAKTTVKKAQREVPRTLENNTDTAVNYVQDKSQNLKRNLSKVPGGAKDVFDEATEPAKDALDDAGQVTKKATKEIKGNFEDLS